MTSFIKKSILGLTAAATLATVAAPAEARRWRVDGDDDAAWAIGAGILGIGIGAAIASSGRSRYHDRYYGGGYYDPYYDRGYGHYDRGYGDYDRGYYDDRYYRRHHRYSYRDRCYTRRVWDPYWGRRVKVRYCNQY